MKEYFLEIFKVNNKEINELYGIRAIGCYIVIAYHCFANGMGYMPTKYHSYLPKLQNFEMMMDLFFVISSFLISYSFSNELRKNTFSKSWKNFFLKRSLRIFPPLYLLIAFSIIIMGLTIQASKLGANMGVMNSGLANLEIKLNHWWADTFYISNYFPNRMLIHGWSLSMEEQFYLTMPLFFLVYTRYLKNFKGRVFLLFLLLALPILIRFYYYKFISLENNEEFLQRIFHPIHTHFDSFIAGILLMEIFRESRESKKISDYKLYFFLVFGITFSFFIYSFTFTFESTPLYHIVFRISIYTLLSFLIVLGTIFGYFSYLKKLLSNIFVVSIGKLSYGIYLVHLYVSGFVMIKTFSYTHQETNDHLVVFKSSLFTFLISAFIALLSYYLVEKPFLKIREWTQPKFNVLTQSFYLIPVSRQEMKLVSWILTLLSFLPYYILKQLIRIDFIEKSLMSNSIQFLFLSLPILLNLFSLIKHKTNFIEFVLNWTIQNKENSIVNPS